MVGVLFVALAAVTALLWMAWRGLRVARTKLKPAVGRLEPYFTRLDAEVSRAEHEVIAPQIEALAWQSGLRAGLSALMTGDRSPRAVERPATPSSEGVTKEP